MHHMRRGHHLAATGILLFVALSGLPTSRAITFDLIDRSDRPAGQGTPAAGSKCVLEEISSAGVLVVGEYASIGGGAEGVAAKINVKARRRRAVELASQSSQFQSSSSPCGLRLPKPAPPDIYPRPAPYAGRGSLRMGVVFGGGRHSRAVRFLRCRQGRLQGLFFRSGGPGVR